MAVIRLAARFLRSRTRFQSGVPPSGASSFRSRSTDSLTFDGRLASFAESRHADSTIRSAGKVTSS